MDHFLGYFAATSIVWLAWPRWPFVVGGLMMLTAALLEALQIFTPDRHADFYAALFGACGAMTQALLAKLFIRVRAAYYRHR
jgi:VanZ family protein